MKPLLRGTTARFRSQAAWGTAKGALCHICGGSQTRGLTGRAQDHEGAPWGPPAHGSLKAPRHLGPHAEGGRSSIEDKHFSFAEAFEEAPVSVDEFGRPSHRPAVRVHISKGPPSFGKPRFNVRGLNEHEALHQSSLWQQLLKQEIDSRVQRQARTAKRTAQVLGARVTQKKGEQRSIDGTKSADAFGAYSMGEAGREGRIPRGIGPHGPVNAEQEFVAAVPQFVEGGNQPEAQFDWRGLSELQPKYEVNAKIQCVEALSNSSQRDTEQALTGAPLPGDTSDMPAQDVALDVFGQQLGDDEAMAGGSPLPEGPQGASLLRQSAGHGPVGKGLEVKPSELIEAENPEALVTHATRMPQSLWERLPPQHLHVQQLILRARTSEDVLAAVGAAMETVGGPQIAAHKAEGGGSHAADFSDAGAAATAARSALSVHFGLDPVNAVTAVHRLGRLSTPYQRRVLLESKQFKDLMGAARVALPLVDPQGASNLLWGLTRLEHAPDWLPQLLQRCASLSPQMSPHQVATCLYSLSRLPMPMAEGLELQAALVEAAAHVVQQLQRPLDLTCICASLARLRVKNTALFGALAGRAQQLLPQLSMSELASVAWVFAAVGLVEKDLFAAMQRRVEADIELCSAGDVVQLAWAFARTGQEKRDLFDYTFTPIIRGFLPQLNARQLATVASSYAQAGVQDIDLLSDLSVTMLPNLSSFTPQHIATVSVAFAHLGYSNRELIGLMGQKTLKLLPSFSARQLTRTVYGLGVAGCTDARLLDSCCSALQQRLHALQPEGVTLALVGLSEAEYLSHPVVPALLRAVSKKPERLFAEDCVQLLLVLSKVDPAARPTQLVQILQEQMQTKLSAHWCLDCDSLCDLMHALLLLRISDQHLLQLTMRKLAYLLGQASSREFLRLAGCLAALPSDDKLLVRTHLHRRLKVQRALSVQLERLSGMAMDLDSTAALLFACAQLGFADDAVVK